MSIREHGGAARYWVNLDGGRVVLCLDGTLLVMRRSRWKVYDEATVEMLDRNPYWRQDTRPGIAAAITRTNREARRGS